MYTQVSSTYSMGACADCGVPVRIYRKSYFDASNLKKAASAKPLFGRLCSHTGDVTVRQPVLFDLDHVSNEWLRRLVETGSTGA